MPPNGRIDLLLAMVSGDAIVLAKLVRMLCPRQVLLFSTPHARQRGWEDNARRMLDAIRGRLIQEYQIVPLPVGDLASEVASFRQSIQAAVLAIAVPQAGEGSSMPSIPPGRTADAG